MTLTINNHKPTMLGLRDAVAMTKDLRANDGAYVQILYDMEDGRVLAHWHHDINSYTHYEDNTVIAVCNTKRRMCKAEIEEGVNRAIALYNALH